MHRNYILVKILFFIAGWLAPSFAVSGQDQSENFYTKGIIFYQATQYSDAESSFAQATGYSARMAQALSLYHLNKISEAMSIFMQSILLADNDAQRFIALYNAATCYFITGNYSSAAKLFIDATRYNPTDPLSKQFAGLSEYLDRIVLAQIARKNSNTNKKSSERGNKTAPTTGFVFDESINLRLEDNEIKDSKSINQQQQLITDRTLLNKLVAAGIKSVTIQNSNVLDKQASFVDLNIQFEFSNLGQASFTPAAEMSELWKRIFELEQGYPASLEHPEQVPGIRPW